LRRYGDLPNPNSQARVCIFTGRRSKEDAKDKRILASSSLGNPGVAKQNEIVEKYTHKTTMNQKFLETWFSIISVILVLWGVPSRSWLEMRVA
jgi:hypothetical protein